MKSLVKCTLAAALAVAVISPAQALNLKSFTESANKAVDQAQQKASEVTSQSQSSLDQTSGSLAVAGDTASLVQNLSSQLGVSTQQAAGGTAALFALAQSKLPTSQFSGITDKVSGLSSLLGSGSSGGGLASSLLGNISSLGGVEKAFSSLGMSSGLISQFTPIITQFLGTQGVTGSVIGALQNLWTPTA